MEKGITGMRVEKAFMSHLLKGDRNIEGS